MEVLMLVEAISRILINDIEDWRQAGHLIFQVKQGRELKRSRAILDQDREVDQYLHVRVICIRQSDSDLMIVGASFQSIVRLGSQSPRVSIEC